MEVVPSVLSFFLTDEQVHFHLHIYDQRKRQLKNSFIMDDISSVKAEKGYSFQLLLNRGGHPVIHFRSKSEEEQKNWMALLKVGLAKGQFVCVCACVRVCVRACVFACMHVFVLHNVYMLGVLLCALCMHRV